MNLKEFYNLYPARETRKSNPEVYSPAVDGVNPLGDDSPLRIWAILQLL